MPVNCNDCQNFLRLSSDNMKATCKYPHEFSGGWIDADCTKQNKKGNCKYFKEKE